MTVSVTEEDFLEWARFKEEIRRLEAENMKLKKEIETLEAEDTRLKKETGKWFQKGRESILRDNRSGCCCVFDELGETVIEPCAAHKGWLEQQKAELQEALKELKHRNSHRDPERIKLK